MGNKITLTEAMIGDNYCDCEDTGLDEHGHSSACAHVMRNDQHFQCGVGITGNITAVDAVALHSVLHSKVGDGICDCCDGSDEVKGKCPNSCGAFFQRAVDMGMATVQEAVTGYRQNAVASVEGAKKLETLLGKHENLLKDRANVYDLANYIEFYLKSERRFDARQYPRMDYKLQASRLKAVSEGKKRLDGKSEERVKTFDNQLQVILDTKCPTSDFTLEEFLATYSASTNDPRRRDDQTSRRRGQIGKTLIAPFIEDPAKLGLRIVGVIVFTPIRSASFLMQKCRELMFGVEEEVESGEGGEEVEEEDVAGGVHVEPTAFEIIKASSPWTPIGFLILLGDLHPALDYKRYKVTRVPINAARRGYRKYVMRPMVVMWEAPEALYNATLIYSDSVGVDPDTHEFRLLKAAEMRAEREKKSIEKKIVTAKLDAEKDYGPLITIESECFSNAVDKYTYRICPLKDVRQDATSLGKFAGWTDNIHRSYLIKGGTKCFGVSEVDEKGNTVQMQRKGVVELKCGLGHNVVSVVENSPCIYEIKFQTPLACGEGEVKRAEEKLRGIMKVALDGGVGAAEAVKERGVRSWFGGGDGAGGGGGGAGDEGRTIEEIKKATDELLAVADSLLSSGQ
ncbi:hypothetical protein TrVE_jg13787 [Triparma verrucosa]|uniref:Glucosidase 2 subunit beta n=1 Tax=Triparma verrucosa TaxID=1606542 RepID=A0A9W7F6G8_9STRA|nr:hypothetical protein TrVE_jg13787 [Triparma verrucosa]